MAALTRILGKSLHYICMTSSMRRSRCGSVRPNRFNSTFWASSGLDTSNLIQSPTSMILPRKFLKLSSNSVTWANNVPMRLTSLLVVEKSSSSIFSYSSKVADSQVFAECTSRTMQHYTSPKASSRPNMMFMFWMAWPEAPLTRLSIAEKQTIFPFIDLTKTWQ